MVMIIAKVDTCCLDLSLKKGNQDKKSERGKYVLTAGNGMTRHEKKSKKYRKTAGRAKSKN